jgi:hypothetical protein
LIPENFYDKVIDKGCLDCIMTNPKNPEENFKTCLQEIFRSMKINGVFYYISTSKPDKRISLITSASLNLKIEIEEISKYSIQII